LLKGRWTLRDLVDFEALAGDARTPDEGAVLEAVKGLEGAEARRVGMKVWLDGVRRGGGDFPGAVWAGGRFVVGALVVVGMFLTGIGVMTGMLDRERMAFHVPMLIGVSVALPLLVLVAGGLAWVVRGKFSGGLSVVSRFLGWLIGKMGGAEYPGLLQPAVAFGQCSPAASPAALARETPDETSASPARSRLHGGKRQQAAAVQGLRRESRSGSLSILAESLRLAGGKGWEAMGWNLVRMTQAGAAMFSAGLMVGLLGCIWFMEIGFYWESTTPEWMAKQISRVVVFLSLPWAWAFPDWVPLGDVFLGGFGENGRILDGRMESTAKWYKFILASIFFWGMLPRLAFWGYAVFRERRALGALDFQSKRHRELWREIIGTRRADVREAPLDGVLVLDVGGTGLKENELRGFLLRRLRVNPGEWFEVGVWDGKGEAAAAESIRKAPAGVVLLAEGWALSPPRMAALHRQIRSLGKRETPIFFLVVNVGSNGKLAAVKGEEKTVWKDFADGLGDAALEVFFHEGEGGP
jgi:hypothetical protein